jgi:BioD-like phosphotransacetylase family protein
MSKKPNLYVCSTTSFCGKSTVSLGLALNFREQGYKVGYFKPIGWEMSRDTRGEKIDDDAQLMAKVLDLDLPIDLIAPVILSERFLEESSRIDMEYYMKKVLQAYKKVSNDVDLMIIEGPYAMGIGTSIGLDVITLVKKLESHVLKVASIENDTTIDRILWEKKTLDIIDEQCLGIILNLIPKTDIERIKGFAIPILEKYNIEVLGVIPENIEMKAPTVQEVCERTNATILTRKDKLDNLIENFLVGAMTPESALTYFRRTLRKAVITGGDRTDIQLAALQTDTSALILTGNIYPDVRVIARAEKLGVPILLVSYDTYTTVRNIEFLTGRIRANDNKKIKLAKKLINTHVEWEKILEGVMA